ncbi:MAG: ThiF family adenylyltransferase [Phycisphaerales bacterium]|nr:ThiF family adenylyltransferase [Phycisphaerales bacterium]
MPNRVSFDDANRRAGDTMNDLARYHRQMLLPGIGPDGQRRLLDSRVLIVGCGALGTVIADALARAGVGALTLVDRDVVELTNLQRQVLFDEDDVREGRPKAIAARDRLARVNSQARVHAVVEDFNHTNAERLAEGADALLDGLDNFQTRYLLNDLSVSRGIPYFYGGAVGVTGMACAFLPTVPTPCLRCVFPEPPPPGSTPTCDTAGVLAGAVAWVAHHQAIQAIKFLTGNAEAVDRSLITFDAWRNEFRRLDIAGARRDGACPCCGQRRFEYLHGAAGSSVTTLCGRGAVQINPRLDGAGRREGDASIDLRVLAARLAPHGEFRVNDHLLRGRLRTEAGDNGAPIELTVFADGRTLVAGVEHPAQARAVFDRYIGG